MLTTRCSKVVIGIVRAAAYTLCALVLTFGGRAISAQTYTINSTTLSRFSGVHPKLYVDTLSLGTIAGKFTAHSSGRWPWIYNTFNSKTNGFQSKTPKVSCSNPTPDQCSDLSEAWQEINGQAMFADAVAYKLTNNPVYLTDALKWARASISYPTWGKDSSSKQAYDLSAAYELHGLAVLYDWCYSALQTSYPADFASIQSTLASRAQGMYEAASGSNPTVTTPQWWGQEWEQNHLWIAETSLAAAALALYGDSGAPSTTTLTTWLQDGLNRWNNTFTYHGSDGADLEGIGYWRYGMEWSFRYFDFANKMLGANMWTDPWVTATGTYRAYVSTAANYWYNTTLATTTDYVDFADCDRTDGSSYVLRKLAAQYTDPTMQSLMQWVATTMDTAGGADYSLIDSSPRDPALYVLWYDDAVTEESPTTAGLPVSKLFSDLGFEISRSDWSGNEAVIAFQSGPPIGHTVQYDIQHGGGTARIYLIAAALLILIRPPITFRSSATGNG